MSEFPTEGHTYRRYDGELNHLHFLVLEMGGLVLSQVRDALTAFRTRDVLLAQRVVTKDGAVDRLEVEADDEIAKLIARHGPVGNDLRMVIAVSKSVSDLERIGDEAVRIAGLMIQLFGHESGDPNGQLVRDVDRIGGLALSSLQCAVEVFDVWDERKAFSVIEKHRELDLEFQSELRRLLTYVMEDARLIGFAINVVLTIKSLERIGHHAQNLAEYVIFQVKGTDIRHAQGSGEPE